MNNYRFWLTSAVILALVFLGYPIVEPWLQYEQKKVDTTNRLDIQTKALTRYNKSNIEINVRLKDLLSKIPSADRIRVGIIRPPLTTDNIGSGLKFDMTHGVARPGHTIGELVTDLPISELNDFLPDLLVHKCSYKRFEELTSQGLINRSILLGLSSVLACGIFNPSSQMIGIILVSWERSLPTNLDDISELVRSAAPSLPFD